jgi:cytochrome c551/c552
MRKTIIAAVAALMVGGFATSASAGVFCASCHSGHKDKVGPAFEKVVAAYGSVDAVFEFLNSDAPLDPKVTAFAKKKGIMKGQLKKYRKLSDAKKAAVREWFEKQVQ